MLVQEQIGLEAVVGIGAVGRVSPTVDVNARAVVAGLLEELAQIEGPAAQVISAPDLALKFGFDLAILLQRLKYQAGRRRGAAMRTASSGTVSHREAGDVRAVAGVAVRRVVVPPGWDQKGGPGRIGGPACD